MSIQPESNPAVKPVSDFTASAGRLAGNTLRMNFLRSNRKTEGLMTRVLFVAWVSLVIGASVTMAAVKHDQHPPEVHVEAEKESTVSRFLWLTVGAVVGVAVFRYGNRLCERVEKGTAHPAQSDWGWRGGWISLDRTCRLVIAANSTDPWTLFRCVQCFDLVPTASDATNGIADGFVVCSAGRHVVNRFSFAPHANDANKFELRFKDEVVGVFERPE